MLEPSNNSPSRSSVQPLSPISVTREKFNKYFFYLRPGNLSPQGNITLASPKF